MSQIHIPRSSGFGDHSCKPGWWVGLLDGCQVVHLRCGGACGRHAGQLEGHTIHPDGRVEPSILCPDPKCGWHVWGILEDWAGGLKMPGEEPTPCPPSS